jgi:hypothetical protein
VYGLAEADVFVDVFYVDAMKPSDEAGLGPRPWLISLVRHWRRLLCGKNLFNRPQSSSASRFTAGAANRRRLEVDTGFSAARLVTEALDLFAKNLSSLAPPKPGRPVRR